MSNNKEFILYNRLNMYCKYVKRYVIPDIPAIHHDIKIHFNDELYHIVQLLFYADYTKGNVRMKYLTDMLVSLSMLNHLSDSLLDIIKNDKHLVKSLEMLGYIKSMVLAWRKSVDEKS